MTKQEFVDQVANKSGLNRREAAKAVDAFLESVTETLRGETRCPSPDSGSSPPRSVRPARASIRAIPARRSHIPAATVPRFQAGSSLKQALKS